MHSRPHSRCSAQLQVQGCNRTSSRVAANPNVPCTCPTLSNAHRLPLEETFHPQGLNGLRGGDVYSGWTFGSEQSYCSSLTLDDFEHFMVAESQTIFWPLCWTLFFLSVFFILEPCIITQFRTCICRIFCTHSHLYLKWKTWSGEIIILNMAHIWRQKWQNFK